jgi:hypothetical protein
MAGKISDDDELSENHDINITPFIDVMLVLLIIFMVAAPLSTVDIPVELPVAVAEPPQRPLKPVFITIAEDLSLSVGETGDDFRAPLHRRWNRHPAETRHAALHPCRQIGTLWRIHPGDEHSEGRRLPEDRTGGTG